MWYWFLILANVGFALSTPSVSPEPYGKDNFELIFQEHDLVIAACK